MTLIEVIVAMAIIAVISVFVLSALLTSININAKSNISVKDAGGVEQAIAGAESATSGAVTTANINFSIGGVLLPSMVDTYTNGGKSYSIFQDPTRQGGSNGSGDPNDPDEPKQLVNFGDGANALPGGTETGTQGGMLKYTITASGRYQLEVWGAQGGGNGIGAGLNFGGNGGYSVGTVRLTAGNILYLYAGGRGKESAAVGTISGGFNGGGLVWGGYTSSLITSRGSGGGGTDIRINVDNLNARIIVAGGGGGSGSPTADDPDERGGAGGGVSGGSPVSEYSGVTGGTQNAGGNKAITGADPTSGAGIFGFGGCNRTTTSTSGGGGGGWYGGGSSGGGAAGGGSGWVFTRAAEAAWTNTTDKPNYLLGTSFYLTDAKTIAGNLLMPDPFSSGSISGKSGGGFIRITYLGS